MREAELYDHDPESPGHNLADELPAVVAELRAILPPPAVYTLVAEADRDRD